MFGRVVPFKALDEPSGFGRRKGFIERGRLMGVEIILDQYDDVSIWKVGIREMF